LVTNGVEQTLKTLRKSKKDHLKEIKRCMSNDIIGVKKQRTITKPNRRDIPGVKGHKKYNLKINAILDTSGSMTGEFEKVLSYIFQKDITINLIQCDTDIKSYVEIKRLSQLQKMPIKGLGGTTLTPGLQYIANDPKLNQFPTVLLTDGYTDSLDFTGLKKNLLVLSVGTNCPVLKSSSTIKVKQIIIDRDA
jgi:predicted metal-dependent peptidase